MTKQETFNIIWNYFVVEAHPRACDRYFQVCMYRTLEGNKCAIGCLIPDELYTRSIEGMGIEDLFLKHTLIPKNLSEFLETEFSFEDRIEFLCYLQDLHDTYQKSSGDFTAYMKKELTEFAWARNLEVPK